MISKIILTVSLCVVAIILLYVLMIIVLKHILHTSSDEAKKKIDDFFTKLIDLLKPVTAPVVYPSLIGSNGIYIRDEIIYRDFERISTLYDDWYYDYAYYNSSNVVVYRFRVYNYKNGKFNKALVQHRVKQITEKALVSTFHEKGLYNIPADGFVAVEVYADILNVYIACTDAGLLEIQQLRNKFH